MKRKKIFIKRSFPSRLLGALTLDPRLYKEVETDPAAFKQAAVVVFFSSLAGGLGAPASGAGLAGFAWGAAAAFCGWMIWTSSIYFVGVKWLAGPMTYSNPGGLLRGAAFASAPGLIRVLGIHPFLRNYVLLIAFVWMLVAMVITVRQSLDYTTGVQAFLICLAGSVFQLGLAFGLLWFKGPGDLLIPV